MLKKRNEQCPGALWLPPPSSPPGTYTARPMEEQTHSAKLYSSPRQLLLPHPNHPSLLCHPFSFSFLLFPFFLQDAKWERDWEAVPRGMQDSGQTVSSFPSHYFYFFHQKILPMSGIYANTSFLLASKQRFMMILLFICNRNSMSSFLFKGKHLCCP